MRAKDIIEKLNLKPHEKEGGYFIETYRCDEALLKAGLPKRYDSNKAFSTAIYYLITPGSYSVMHRLRTDEIFHFYLGDPVVMLQLYYDGTSKRLTLGNNLLKDEIPQLLVPKGVWQGAFLKDGGEFALLGCTVAPGFDYNDYETAIQNYIADETLKITVNSDYLNEGYNESFKQ